MPVQQLFLYGYFLPQTHKSTVIFFTEPLRIIEWFLTFLGSSIGYVNNIGYLPSMVPRVVSILTGIAILFFYFYLTIVKYYKRNVILYAFYTFMILTALMATRCRLFDEFPSASRYQIQSIIFVILSYIIGLGLMNDRQQRVIFPIILLLSMLFSIMSFRINFFQVVAKQKNRLIAETSNMEYYRKRFDILER